MKRRYLAVPMGIITVILMGSSSCDNATTANMQEQNAQLSQQDQYNQAQPLPFFKWSQYRETLVEIETAQAHTVQTTSFGFNQGTPQPVWSCPSVGFPMPTTANLSNPFQENNHGQYGGGNTVVGQMDPNGVYAGTSSGTYVVCIAADGSSYLHYWEGYVDAVSGPAVWDGHEVKIIGPSTVHVQTKP